MAERLEDLNLPNAVVGRLLKEALPDGVIISKEARTAVAKAASVFIIYLTSNAVEVSQKGNRKILSGADIIEALENVEFDEFIEPVQEFWSEFKEGVKRKKELKEQVKASKEAIKVKEEMVEMEQEVIELKEEIIDVKDEVIDLKYEEEDIEDDEDDDD